MIYRFGDFELDVPKRELRHLGAPRKLQPQVFELLRILVERRERVVSKRELLETIWPDAVVTEGSLARVASLARTALAPDGDALVRTFTGHGYRFVGEVEEAAAGGSAHPPSARPPKERPRTRYARSGDVHVAFRAIGEGDVDIVLVLGWALPMEALFELPELERNLRALAALGRVLVFDKRGTGLSDRVKGLASLDDRMDDLRAVLDEAGSERAILLGISEGGPLAIAFAAAHPARVAGLVLVGAFARMTSAPDHPHGWKRSEFAKLRAYMRTRWGEGATTAAIVPKASMRPEIAAWAAAAETAGASPGAASDLLEMNVAIDVRDRLGAVSVPTVVLHAGADRVVDPGNARDLAARIPGARLVEREGDDHTFSFDGAEVLRAEVERLVRLEESRR